MNQEFPRIITILRKEKGITQKQAATDLGVSQAMLSHYEKGIRECGLDFLVRIADYYDVSTDYLLGRSISRKGDSAAEAQEGEEPRRFNASMVNQINRKLLLSSTSVIYDLLAQLGDKRFTNAVSNYLMSAEYQVFRTIYSADPKNDQNMFSIDLGHYRSLTSASMMFDLEYADAVMEHDKLSMPLSPDILSGYFDIGASSLFNLVMFAERNVKSRGKSN